tara:strand:+ start:35 stop:487 length:453 start_codon:yes stop_codon:yes gene_type:complete
LVEGVMKIERTWAMPNKRTFTIDPIKKLIEVEIGGEYIDPFPFEYKEDATDYLQKVKSHRFGVFDPPYSPRQLKECYKGKGEYDTKSSTWSGWKDLMAQKVLDKCISFGWNTCGLGKKRGFEITRILIVCHGGMHNDTICTVEHRVQERL